MGGCCDSSAATTVKPGHVNIPANNRMSQGVGKDGGPVPYLGMYTKFRPFGKMPGPIQMENDGIYDMMGGDPDLMRMNPENVKAKREELSQQLAGEIEKQKAFNAPYAAEVITKEIFIPGEDGHQIKIICNESKQRPPNSSALVFAHPGGAVTMTAEENNQLMIRWAHMYKCLVFNVDYRLGPETKAPGGQRDFMQAFLHLYENASKFKIDKNKIGIMGDSGGGHIVLGAAYQLILQNKSHLPRLMILRHSQLRNEMSHIPNDQLGHHEKHSQDMMCDIYKLLATDYEKQTKEKDPVLYPGLMSMECLKRLPPTVICTCEFDFLRRDALALIPRLREAGRLIDVLDMPGGKHSYESQMDAPESLLAEHDTLKVWKRWVCGEQGPVAPCKSKNLFAGKYKYQGYCDEDNKEMYESMLGYLGVIDDPLTVDQPEKLIEFKEGYKMACEAEFDKPLFKEEAEKVETEEVIIPPGYGNLFPVRMLVHTAKDMIGQTGVVPYVTLHGGGGFAGSVDLQAIYDRHYAIKLRVKVFAVQYLLAGSVYGDAPESSCKFPDGQGGEVEMPIPATEGKWCSADESANATLAALRYIHENADKFGVDKTKVVVDGCSGGGYAATMACGRMAVLGESNLVKLVVIAHAATPGSYIGKKASDFKNDITKVGLSDCGFLGNAFAVDFDKQWKEKDPVLFPQQGSEYYQKQWPPIIYLSAEFDNFEEIVEKDFLPRMRKMGRLLDNLCHPGVAHAFFYDEDCSKTAKYWEDMDLIFKHYILC